VRAGAGEATRQALGLELSCRYLSPLLDLAEGLAEGLAAPRSDDLDRLFAEWNVTRAELRGQTNWVTLRFCEALTEWLAARIGADHLAREVARFAYSRKALGFLYPLLRAFGSPGIGYAQLPKFVGVLNKVSVVKLLSFGRGRAEIEYAPASGAE